MAERIYGHCRACHMTCPAYYTVEDDEIIAMEGVPPEEGGTGIICGRGMATLQIQNSPTRVKYPLKRVGKRGEGKWERISWEQACTEIAEKMHEMIQKYGGETFVFPGRTGRHDTNWISYRIARTIGSPNSEYGPMQQCYLPQTHSSLNFGNDVPPVMGIDPQTRLVLSTGIETNYSFPLMGMLHSFSRQVPYKQIVLDPVCGPRATEADEWVPIRPGTDLAYYMCIIRDLIESRSYDYDFVVEWSNAPFLVNLQTGDMLTEADIVRGGSAYRYLFWDEASDSLMWWDREEVQWQGGESGRAHYDQCVENCANNIMSHDFSPATKPEGITPALFGSHEIKSETYACTFECKPAFELLWENVRDMTPERCAEICGVDSEQVKRVCQMVDEIRPCAVMEGLQYQATNAGQYFNAVNIVKILVGSVDRPGGSKFGLFYPVTPQPFPGEFHLSYADALPIEQKRKRLGYYDKRIISGMLWEQQRKLQPLRNEEMDGPLIFSDLKAVLHAAETGDPYEVHGIVAVCSNWLMHDPSTARWMRLMKDESKIQLHVVTEIVMSPTAELADYVLPAQTWMERNYFNIPSPVADNRHKDAFRRAVKPVGEARHDYEIGAMLAHALEKIDPSYNYGMLNPPDSEFWGGQYGKLWESEWFDEERDRVCRDYGNTAFEKVLDDHGYFYPPEASGVNFESYRIAGRFPTFTGKAELYVTAYQKCGYSPVPFYSEPAESPISRPDIAKDYPLVFTSGKRQAGFFHSEFRQVPYLREMNPVPEVFMNPATAAEYGVQEGDWVWVESSPDKGRAPYNRIIGKLSFRLMCRPDLVSYSQHGWWRPEKAADDDLHGAFEFNVECILECENESPDCGTMGLRSQLCRVYKATDEEVEALHPMITRDELESMMPLKREEM